MNATKLNCYSDTIMAFGASFDLDGGVENFEGTSGQAVDELDGASKQYENTCNNIGDEHLDPSLSGADIDRSRLDLSEPCMSGYPALGESELSDSGDHKDYDVFATGIDVQERDVNFDHETTQHVFRQSLPSTTVQHFWERDPFLSSVFGTGNVVDDLFPRVNLKRPHTAFVVRVDDSGSEERPVVKALYKGSKRPVYMSAIKHSADEIEDNKRKAALSGWTTLVLVNASAFSALDDALDHAFRRSSTGLTDAGIREVTHRTLAECLASKATSTLLKRLGSLRRYVGFCLKTGADVFPLEEQSMYDFMNALQDMKGVGASSGRSFLEAVRFSGAMLGLQSSGACMVSRRLAGLGEMLAKQVQPTLQASPLSVKQIVALERLCCGGESLHDRVISGGVLMMIFGCARASDIARAVKLTVDRVDPSVVLADGEPKGYIEVGVLGHKGARSAQHKRMLLPVVAPMMSISDGAWWDSWLEARMALGLDVEGDIRLPLMCKFDLDGKPTDRSLQASEIGGFIRKALDLETERRNWIRSHSCKVSMLSWMAKYGSPLNLRRNIGHHLDVTSKSAEIYARDAMAPALYELCKVVGMVKMGKFDPDCTRSGRFNTNSLDSSVGRGISALDTKGTGQSGDTIELEKEVSMADTNSEWSAVGEPEMERFAGDTDGTDTDSSSDASSISHDEVDDSTTLAELWEMVRPSLRPKMVEVDPKLQKFVHKLSMVVHLKHVDSSRFLCGRLASSRYEHNSSGTSVECPRCTTCFQSKDAGARTAGKAVE